MTIPKLLSGTVHTIPQDVRQALTDHPAAITAWNNLTPLARNEFICWVEEAKRDDTRKKRIHRTVTEITEGKRRPCCWLGCVHRTDKPISPSIKGILAKRARRS